jgi:hypothetical protein
MLRPTFYATADCFSNCMAYCWNGGSETDPEYCRDALYRCHIECEVGNSYGAIAYSAKDQGVGWSRGSDDLSKAKKAAMDNCAARGSACKLLVWFNNSCGALATDGNIVRWGTALVKHNADQRALAECKKAAGKECAIQASVCSP